MQTHHARRKQWRTATCEKRSLSETIMDPDRGHYRRLAKIKGLAAVFAPDRSTKNEEKPVPLFFAFHLFGIFFPVATLPSRYAKLSFIRRKFFAKEHRNERNIIYSRIKITRIWYSSFQRNLKKEQSVNVTLLNPRMPRSTICFSRSNEYVHQHKLMFSQATARNIILSNDTVKAKTTVTR